MLQKKVPKGDTSIIKVAMEMLKPVDECTNMVGPPFDVKDVGLVVNINLSKLTRIPSWLHPFKE